MRINLRIILINTRIIKEAPRLSKKELVISVTELVSKALHKNKASTRIRLFCGGFHC
ncbi:tautomerase family protein [Helicobacter pylori]|uniref:tautomerase family protein n=1 Tax=Helicobacter pylori TaxID=210 RepID=UPI0002D92DA8|nr:tautomerase family protein [Helicobacter pylori]